MTFPENTVSGSLCPRLRRQGDAPQMAHGKENGGFVCTEKTTAGGKNGPL